jgi:hypothetical protein
LEPKKLPSLQNKQCRMAKLMQELSININDKSQSIKLQRKKPQENQIKAHNQG